MAENLIYNPRSKQAPLWGWSVVWFYLTKRGGGRVKYLQRRIRDRLERANMIWVVSVIKKQWTDQPQILTPESIRKYDVIIRKDGAPAVQPTTLVFSDMYVNRYLIFFLDGYERFTFHVKIPNPTISTFLQIPSLPLLLPSLLFK